MNVKTAAGGIQYGGGKKVGKANESISHKHHGGVLFRVEDERQDVTCCFCFKSQRSKRMNLITTVVANLGIFALLLAYTLLGSFVFLAIEGGAAKMHQKTLATTVYHKEGRRTALVQQNSTSNLTMQATAELRSQTVENIWEITVSLNILYKENWTRLAAQEIARYQDQLVQRVAAEMVQQYSAAKTEKSSVIESSAEQTGAVRNTLEDCDWTFAKAFLYSLTVLTTIGYGNVAPKTSLGKAVTMGYALLGIPLTLLYLSVVGSLLSKLVRSVFSRMFCCCLCSDCGYCCYDHGIIDGHNRKKAPERHNLEYGSQMISLQEPYYVRSPSGTIISAAQAQRTSTCSVKDKSFSILRECDSLGCENDPNVSFHTLSILAPVFMCIALMGVYIVLGALILRQMEGWYILDGIFFCFMCLSTVGFGSLVPGSSNGYNDHDATVWFCSIYIISGLALTAMCFNVLHDEIIHRIHHQERALRLRNHKNAEFSVHHRS